MAFNKSVHCCDVALKRAITALAFSVILIMTKVSIAQAPVENIDVFEWQNRIILVQSESDCASTTKVLNNQQAAVTDRHVLWFVICDDKITSNFNGVLSEQFIDKIKTKYFKHSNTNVILIGKDGGIKQRSDILDLASLFDLIDSMPMRQLEMQNS